MGRRAGRPMPNGPTARHTLPADGGAGATYLYRTIESPRATPTGDFAGQRRRLARLARWQGSALQARQAARRPPIRIRPRSNCIRARITCCLKIVNADAAQAAFTFACVEGDVPADIVAIARQVRRTRTADEKAAIAKHHRSIAPLLNASPRAVWRRSKAQRKEVDAGVLRTLVAMAGRAAHRRASCRAAIGSTNRARSSRPLCLLSCVRWRSKGGGRRGSTWPTGWRRARIRSSRGCS